MVSSEEDIAKNGWTAVPVDPKIVLGGKPYIHEPEPLLVKDIAFPWEDPVVAKVHAYAKERLPTQTFNHCMRVFYFGERSRRRVYHGRGLELEAIDAAPSAQSLCRLTRPHLQAWRSSANSSRSTRRRFRRRPSR